MDSIDLRDYERVVIFTGAGASAESGVPTYRGKGGIWKEYDYEAYACQEAFERDPEAVWEFHNYRRGIVAACAPNAAHHQIAELQRLQEGVTVITQNIDGLHQAAGAEQVFELHGSLWRVRCDPCGTRRETRDSPLTELRCPGCGGYWRPDITWFGDPLDQLTFTRAMEAAIRAQVLVVIGTSAVVFPAAQIPLLARQAGAVLVEINPEETQLSGACLLKLRGSASEMFPKLLGD